MQTKNKRLIILASVFMSIVFLGIFSSQIFKLKQVEVQFYTQNNKKVNFTNNTYYNTAQKVNNIVTSTNFDYNTNIFLINKQKYVAQLELKNPYLKLNNIETIFPNKLKINVTERLPTFYIKNKNNFYLLDSSFKLLQVSNALTQNNLIQIKVTNINDLEVDFFSFFNILPQVYQAGQNLKENNLVLNALADFYSTYKNYVKANPNFIILSLTLYEVTAGTINVKFSTNSSSYGTTLIVEDCLFCFNKKLNKLFNALKTLYLTEPIKCTHGLLIINKNFNCYWNNL